MRWLQARLREPSTAAGFGTILLAVAQFKPEWGAYAASIAGALGALAGVTSEPGKPQQ